MPKLLRPMTPADVHQVLGRAILDADFRKQLTADPQATLALLGFKVTPQAAAFFAQLSAQQFTDAGDTIEKFMAANPVPNTWY